MVFCLLSEPKVNLGYWEGNFEDYEVLLDWRGSLFCKDYKEKGIYGVTVMAREKKERMGWDGKPFKTIIAWKHIAKQDIVTITYVKKGVVSVSDFIPLNNKRIHHVEHFDWRWKEIYQRLATLFENPCIKRGYKGKTPYIKLKWNDFKLILEDKFIEDFRKNKKCLNERILEVLPHAKSPADVVEEIMHESEPL
jgi:hypothetical protein